MQAHLTDKKLSILFDKYRDADFASNAQKEVEDIRRRALTVGGVTTGAAFVINEVSRLTMRSRKYRLEIERNQSHNNFYSGLQAQSIECYFLVSRPHRCF